MRILVIDDDPGIAQIVVHFLSSSTHHEARAALSAKEAMEAISIAEDPFDCFLVDIQMPDVDGIHLVRLIRQTPGYRHAPIIMLTAMKEKTYLDRAFAAGATDYVGKPFDYQDLQRRLHDAQRLSIDKARAQDRPVGEAELRRSGGEPKAIALNDPIALPDVKVAVDCDEFENYARHLLRRHFRRSTTIAVKIGSVDRLCADSTTAEFVSQIRAAATAVQDTLLEDGGILSYRGNGIFLCIPGKRLKAGRDALQAELNRRYDALDPSTGHVGCDLQVGDPVPLGSGSDSHALDCLARAIDSLDNQPSNEGGFFDIPKRLLQSRRLNDEQKRLEKRAFEFLLRDSLAGPEDDAWQRHLARRESPSESR